MKMVFSLVQIHLYLTRGIGSTIYLAVIGIGIWMLVQLDIDAWDLGWAALRPCPGQPQSRQGHSSESKLGHEGKDADTYKTGQ